MNPPQVLAFCDGDSVQQVAREDKRAVRPQAAPRPGSAADDGPQLFLGGEWRFAAKVKKAKRVVVELVAEKTSDPQQRQTLQIKSDELLAPLIRPVEPLAGLAQAEVRVIETVELECAQVFQRSSSCVEGRNGQLPRRHHSMHRLTDRELAALTAVHDYFIRRGDGTTAAERSFGAKPKDLLAWILGRVDLPGWSAQKRSQPQPKTWLLQATT
jgi:Family of unknown function (DUF6399)